MVLTVKKRSALKRGNLLLDEKGAALTIALMFLAILALLGSAAVVTTTTDMRIGNSHRLNTRTFYHAEGGVHFVLGTIEHDLKQGTTLANGTGNVLPSIVDSSEPFTASLSDFFLTISDITKIEVPTGQPLGNYFFFSSTSEHPSDGSMSTIEVVFRLAGVNPAFQVGMLSDANITINGAPNITGSMHANGNVTQNGAGTIDGDVSAMGNVNVGSAVSGSKTPNASRIDVPLITSSDFNGWRTQAQQSPNTYSASSFTYSQTGDQSYKIVFADGNITVSGTSLRNVTIIATGNITVNGSSSMNGNGTIGTAMIAGGNITFNGSSHTYGAFWCNGSFTQNGSSMLEGSIVAGGNITRNGVFKFTANPNLENEHLPPSNDCDIISWKDTSL